MRETGNRKQEKNLIEYEEKKTAKMLVNGRPRNVHVHKVNGLELRKHTHTHTQPPELPKTSIGQSIRTAHTCVYISSIHIQAPFYL